MAISNKALRVPFAKGTGNSLAKSKNDEMAWGRFKRQFLEPYVADCTRAEYEKMGKDAQRKAKSGPGWIMRAPVDKGKRNKNNTNPGVLVSGDADYFDAEDVELLLSGEMFDGIEHFAHSTFSNTPDEPRFRVFLLCDRKITPQEYGIVVRLLLAQKGVIDKFDKASKNVAQMMFMPGVPKDDVDEYVFVEHAGDPLDVDMLLKWGEAEFGDLDDPANWPRWESENKDSMRHRASKAENPLEKRYPVGPWCNAYSIYDLIDGKDNEDPILGEFFEMAGEDHEPNRVNYIPGSGAAGCIIYDDGLFLYSWHDSDPGGNENLNAWDLCRVHLFGDKDDPHATYASPTDRPSYKAMLKFARDDEHFQQQTIEANLAAYDEIDAADDYEDDADDDDGPLGLTPEEAVDAFFESLDSEYPIVKREKPGKPPKGWRQTLTMNSDGLVMPTMQNVTKILRNDPRWHNRIGWNDFYGGVFILADIKTKVDAIPDFKCDDTFKGTLWGDPDSDRMRAILQAPRSEGGYDLAISKQDFESALVLAALNFTYNPVIEHKSELAEKHPDDGRNYMGDFLHEFFGTPDDIYHRQLWTNFMIAAVMRAHEPGSKFDFCPIFEGGQGIGKSTFVHTLFKPFDGALSNNAMKNEKDAVEGMMGHHGMELAELASMNKAEVEDAKDFLSRLKHNVRMAYGKHPLESKRKTLFIGTTNQDKPLRDQTGNRRFWIIRCGIKRPPERVALQEWIEKMWAQAYRAYHDLRRAQPHDFLDLSLHGKAKLMAEKVAEGALQKSIADRWADKMMAHFTESIPRWKVAAEYNPAIGYDDLGMTSASDWKKEWGDRDEPVCRIFATEDKLKSLITGFERGEFKTQTEVNQFETAIDILKSRGFARCVTNKPTKSQEDDGVRRAPRIGGKYLKGVGVCRAGYLWVSAAQKQNLSWASIPEGEAPNTDSGGSQPEDNDDLI